MTTVAGLEPDMEKSRVVTERETKIMGILSVFAPLYTIAIVGGWMFLWPSLNIPTSDPAMAALYGWLSAATSVVGLVTMAFVYGYERGNKMGSSTQESNKT